MHATAQVKTEFQGRRADGFEPGGGGRCQVEGGDEVVPQLVGDDVTGLQLVFGVIETDQDEAVLERRMLDRDLRLVERLFHLIEGF